MPLYRVPLFDALVAKLAADGIDCTVVAPQPDVVQLQRGDASVGNDWHQETRAKVLRIGSVTLRSFGSSGHLKRCDAAIVPLIGSCLDSHVAIAMRARGVRVGLWGHVGAFVKPAHRIDVEVERAMMRSVDHVFAYTPAGSRLARQRGVRPDRVTTLMNTIDTESLELAIAELSECDVKRFVEQHHLTLGRTFAYIGGLDSTKSVDLLVQVLDELWKRDPFVKVLVGGDGGQRGLLDAACRRGQAVRLGYVNEHQKALMARTSSAILNPGRVGLLAVDALVMKLPVVSSRDVWHGPEVEYLRDQYQLIEAPPDGVAFADVALGALTAQGRYDGLPPTMADMSDRFYRGVRTMIKR